MIGNARSAAERRDAADSATEAYFSDVKFNSINRDSAP